jgi:rubrerythrin
MSDAGAPQVTSLADLYAIAYQIEADAAERYSLLAEQMEVHNNPGLARIFRDLERAEGIHRDEIVRMAGGVDIATHALAAANWRIGESPEAADLGGAHYLMTPRAALEMALTGEEQAVAFFTQVLSGSTDPAIQRLAAAFVTEEKEHVELCHRLLRRYPSSDLRSGEDPDPPIPQE